MGSVHKSILILQKKNEAAAARKDELLDWVIAGALENDQISALGSCR
jgi:hypothetical protein